MIKIDKFNLSYNGGDIPELQEQLVQINHALKGKQIQIFTLEDEFLYVVYTEALPLKQRYIWGKFINHHNNFDKNWLGGKKIVQLSAREDFLVALVE